MMYSRPLELRKNDANEFVLRVPHRLGDAELLMLASRKEF